MARTTFRLAPPTLVILAWLVFHLPLAAQSAQLVDDLQPFGETNPSSETRFLTRIGQRAIFEAFKTGVGYQRWSTDGTAEGTEVMPQFMYPTQIGTLQGRALVVDGTQSFEIESSFPRGLFLSDGTAAGTQRLPPRSLVVSLASDRVEGGRYLFFGWLGDEPEALWVTDGSPEGLRRVAALGERTFSSATMAAGRLYFLATDRRLPSGCGSDEPPSDCQRPVAWRLWSSDGTAAGTRASSLTVTALPPARQTAPPMTVHGVLGETVFVSAPRSQPARRVLYGVRAGVVQELATLNLDEDQVGPLLSPRFETLPGRVAFYAHSHQAGWELWTSDGTARGTRRASELEAELAVGERSAPPAATADGKLVFLASGDEFGPQLWATDGTPANTRRLTQLPPVSPIGERKLGTPVSFDGKVYFVAGDDSGVDFWVTDGTPAGTRVLLDTGVGGATTFELIAGGAQLFFMAGRAGESPTVWAQTLGSGLPRPLVAVGRPGDRVPGAWSGVSLHFRFTFAADDGQHGMEPWVAESGGGGRLITDLEPGEGPSSNPVGLTRFGDRALFFACQGEEIAFFVTSGRSGETRRLHGLGRDCATLANEWRFSPPPPIAVVGDLAFHAAGTDGQLWRTDGTTEGTFALTNFIPPPFIGAETRGPVGVGSKVVFAQLADVDPETLELSWRFSDSDGSLQGTRLLFTRRNNLRGLELVGGEDRFYFDELDIDTGQRFFSTSDGTLEGTEQLASSRSRVASSTASKSTAPTSPRQMVRFEGRDFFVWNGDLWVTDGTPQGTEEVSGLLGGASEPHPTGLCLWNQALYMFAPGLPDGGRALWRTDGTAEGTERLFDFGTSLSQTNLVPLGDQLHWAALTFPDLAGEIFSLYSTDGTPEGSSRRLEIGLGVQPSFTTELVAFDGRLYFPTIQSSTEANAELWATDGTAAGTGVVQDIHAGLGSSEPAQLLALPDRLLFAANDGVTGRELWAIEGGDTGCEPSATALCLGNGRVRAEVVYQDRAGRQHTATAEPLTTEAGAFSFFRAGNLDLFIKVLDGSSVNGQGWVFVGSLSDAGFILTLTDTETGAARRYTNFQGRFASFADTQAFDFRGALAQAEVELPHAAAVEGRPALATKAGGPCVPATARLCLLDGRFAVEIDWARPGASGEATMQPGSNTSGTFWFFRPENLEGAVKIIDGRPVNGRFWFFFTGLTNLELTITVTDTETGQSKTYFKPRGTFAAFGDTAGI